MNTITVRPLEKYMLNTIRFEKRDEEIKQHLDALLQSEDARLFGAVLDDRLIGIGGIWKFGYVHGEWGMWLTPEMRAHPLWIVKTCRRYIHNIAKEMDIQRIIVLVNTKKSEAYKFAWNLGFNKCYPRTVIVDDAEYHVLTQMVN